MRKEMMLEEGECIQTIFIEYINNLKNKEVFLIFEGKDDFKYYCPRILPYLGGKEYGKYHCGGKKEVIQLHAKINSCSENKSKNIITLYFVDRDYDDNNTLSNDIFITPTYSIENLYFTDSALRNMLIGEMGISEQSDKDLIILNTALNFIKVERDKIINKMLYGNACYSLQIKKSSLLENDRPGLKDIKDYNKIITISSIDKLKEKVSNYIEITNEEVEYEKQRISSNAVNLIRGKYLLETLPKIIMKLVEHSNKGGTPNSIFERKINMTLNTSSKTILSDLSHYADTPLELNEYIIRRQEIANSNENRQRKSYAL